MNYSSVDLPERSICKTATDDQVSSRARLTSQRSTNKEQERTRWGRRAPLHPAHRSCSCSADRASYSHCLPSLSHKHCSLFPFHLASSIKTRLPRIAQSEWCQSSWQQGNPARRERSRRQTPSVQWCSTLMDSLTRLLPNEFPAANHHRRWPSAGGKQSTSHDPEPWPLTPGVTSHHPSYLPCRAGSLLCPLLTSNGRRNSTSSLTSR